MCDDPWPQSVPSQNIFRMLMQKTATEGRDSLVTPHASPVMCPKPGGNRSPGGPARDCGHRSRGLELVDVVIW